MNKAKDYYRKIIERGFASTISHSIEVRMDKLILSISKIIFASFQLKNVIIMESHNDFDSNDGAFYNYLIANDLNKKYKIVWLIRNKKPQNLPQNVLCFNMNKPSFRKSYYLCIAKYYTGDHNLNEKVRGDQKSFYLTHGAFPLKAFKGKIGLPKSLDYCLCPSEYVAPILANQFLLPYPNNIQVFLGFPVHDVFYTSSPGDLRKVTRKKYSKVVLWMPTFRKTKDHLRNDSKTVFPLGIPIFKERGEVEDLNDLLAENNSLLIIKIHPMQDLDDIKVSNFSNIIILDGETIKKYDIDNYRLMKDTDALISDYSSVAYDYLHKGNPIAYTLDDLEDYVLGLLVENPYEWMAGNPIYNVEDFINFVYDVLNGNDIYKEQRKRIFDIVFKYHDGKSSERLAEFIGLTQ